MKYSVIAEKSSYTFSDYFRLNIDADDLAHYFGYQFKVETLTLPRAMITFADFVALKTRLEKSLSHITLNSETARREFLIAPVLLEVAFYTNTKIRVEYQITVNDRLKGTLDYYLATQNQLLIVEAKHADPQRGFSQLTVELIALDHWLEDEAPTMLYGAVSMGDVWRFGQLDRETKLISQDITLITIPGQLETLLQHLIGILTGAES